MAVSPSLRYTARQIARAARKAALDQGLSPDDYVLVGSFDGDSGRISLTFGTAHSVDDRRLYADTFAELRQLSPDYPQMTMHLGLVIRKVNNLEDAYLEIGAEGDLDITDMLEIKSH